LFLFVVRRGNLRHENDVGELFGSVVTDERLGAFRENRLVEGDGFF
jgi:hypothetical protein